MCVNSHGYVIMNTLGGRALNRIFQTSPKKFSKGKQAHVGMERSKTSRTRWERHHNTFTPSLHLVPFCQLCFVFVSCVHRRVEEGSGEGIAVCCAC